VASPRPPRATPSANGFALASPNSRPTGPRLGRSLAGGCTPRPPWRALPSPATACALRLPHPCCCPRGNGEHTDCSKPDYHQKGHRITQKASEYLRYHQARYIAYSGFYGPLNGIHELGAYMPLWQCASFFVARRLGMLSMTSERPVEAIYKICCFYLRKLGCCLRSGGLGACPQR